MKYRQKQFLKLAQHARGQAIIVHLHRHVLVPVRLVAEVEKKLTITYTVMDNTKAIVKLAEEAAKSLVISKELLICWFLQRKLKILVSKKPRRFLIPKFSFICAGKVEDA